MNGSIFYEYNRYFYSIKFPILIGLRIIIYRALKWGYFLLDFCYYANMLVIIFLWVYPSQYLFYIAYAATHGPLMWAILTFRNR